MTDMGVSRSYGTLFALVLTGALAGNPSLVVAQTAKDLDCKGCVESRDVGKASVTTKKIKGGAITNGKIKKNAVTSSKIKNGEVKTADLAKGAVSNAKIKNNAITSDKIKDGTITAADLAPGVALGGTNFTTGVFDTGFMENGDEFLIAERGDVFLLLQCFIDENPPNDNSPVEAQLRLVAFGPDFGDGYNATGADNSALESTDPNGVVIDFKTTDNNDPGQTEVTNFDGSGAVHDVDTGDYVGVDGEATVVALGGENDTRGKYCRAVGTFTTGTP